MLDSFINQYRVRYKLLTQTLKQSKTREDEIVLLPFERKIMHHAPSVRFSNLLLKDGRVIKSSLEARNTRHTS